MTKHVCPVCHQETDFTGRAVLVEDRNLLLVGGATIHLSRNKFATLKMLALHAPRMVAKDTLYDCVPRYGDGLSIKVVDVEVHHLRVSLQGTPLQGAIKTVWGEGYLLNTRLDVQVVEREPIDEEGDIDGSVS